MMLCKHGIYLLTLCSKIGMDVLDSEVLASSQCYNWSGVFSCGEEELDRM